MHEAFAPAYHATYAEGAARAPHGIYAAAASEDTKHTGPVPVPGSQWSPWDVDALTDSNQTAATSQVLDDPLDQYVDLREYPASAAC